MIKRTVVIGDAKVIDEFKALCRKLGRIPGKVMIDLMAQYIVSHISPRSARGKKA